MLERPLRLAAILCSTALLLSFGLFAVDEARTASGRTQAEIAGDRAARLPDPSPRQERARERAHGSVREAIDDVNDVLVAPFAGVVGDDADRWARRGLPALIGLAVYGFGLGFLARIAGVR